MLSLDHFLYEHYSKTDKERNYQSIKLKIIEVLSGALWRPVSVPIFCLFLFENI